MEAAGAVHQTVDFGRGKNEAILGEVGRGVVGFAFGCRDLGEGIGLAEGFFEGGFAIGLEGAEASFAALDFAGEALFIDGKEREFLGIGPEDAGLGHGGVDFGVSGVEVAGFHGVAEGDAVVFDGAGAIETPFVFGDGLGDLDFEGSDGAVGVADFAGELIEGAAVFFGHEGDLAGEAVADCVQGGADFALWSYGPGGVLRVAAVGFELFLGGGHGLRSLGWLRLRDSRCGGCGVGAAGGKCG